MSISIADRVSRIPSDVVNAIGRDAFSTLNSQTSRQLDKTNNNYREVVGNVFDSTDSIAYCVSAGFQMSAVIPQYFKRKPTTRYLSNLDHTHTALREQWVPKTRCFVYHMMTKPKTATDQLLVLYEHSQKDFEHTLRIIAYQESVCLALDQDSTNGFGTFIRYTLWKHSEHHPFRSLLTDHRPLTSTSLEPFQGSAQQNACVKAQQPIEALKHVRR